MLRRVRVWTDLLPLEDTALWVILPCSLLEVDGRYMFTYGTFKCFTSTDFCVILKPAI
jgi:hypothetical protein